MNKSELRAFLDEKVHQYNTKSFIPEDPISIPHTFKSKQDIEIAGFWTAIFSWGQRKTIINKAKQLFGLMGESPIDFIINHRPHHLKRFLEFKHRTFQPTDTLYFINFLKWHFTSHSSLESAFTRGASLEENLKLFHEYFFSLNDVPLRTRKHVSTPSKNSTCKRLNMFLRWMVRKDDSGVDFGIWNDIKPKDLLIPLDVHVDRVARNLGLLERKQTDWKAVVELTNKLSQLDPSDPVKYDYALFGIGVMEKGKTFQ